MGCIGMLLCLVSMACCDRRSVATDALQTGTTPSNGSSQPEAGAGASVGTGEWHSGSRLRVLRIAVDLASPFPSEPWDSQFKVPCRFRWGPDREWRCYPSSVAHALVPPMFTDPLCKTPVVVSCSRDAAVPPVVAWRDPDAPQGDVRVVPPAPIGLHYGLLGAEQSQPDAFFAPRAGVCTRRELPAPPSGTSCHVHALVRELTPSDFARGEVAP